ncbi:MAG: DNA (cytosine-5-)-methyltransferase [Candidatus Amesbacteria bacterium]|nr:DNA (cytosine-5-)-methyltransferase [Candidatus Amesbacteria bacterium]
MNDNLTVAEVAQKLSVSADTIRRWEKSGLIKSRRSENNYRLFNYNEAERVKKKLRGGGSSNGYKILKSTKKTNFNIIELFTGAGGTALGLENAGLVHELAVELDKNACKTIRSNRPHWNLLEDDIRNIDFKPWKGKVDIIEGGFPCQSFSYAGKGMGFGETRGTLFFEFARAIQETMPKIAVGENVKGLLKHDQGRTLDTMLKKLNEIGYRVGYKVLRSQYLDVPQKRERLIIIAVRNDLSFPLLLPKEKDYYISIREALMGVPKSDGQKYPKRKSEILNLVPPGGYWKDLPLGIQKEYMGRSYYLGGGKTGMARRLSFDEPSLTLTCAPAQKQTERCHPTETRPLTIREYARIQTFPDQWDFIGSMSSRYKQIGNAVPVNLGYHIGKSLIAMLENTPDLSTMEIINSV